MFSQTDRLYFHDGRVAKGQLVSVGKESVFFRMGDSSGNPVQLLKKDVLMIAKYDGKIYAFTEKMHVKDSSTFFIKKNAVSLQPFSFMFGRLGGSYERMLSNGKIGILIPVILTFDPVGVIYKPSNDTDRTASNAHRKGVNFITGADVNFYFGKKPENGFFFGPRLRYGVDMLLRNIEAYSVQTQFGWRMENPRQPLYHSLSFGFGFVRILSSMAGNRIDPKATFGWASINYRVGIGW